ncbi:MAG: tetratricopeptide repeat protein, partial [Myxococcota bacterium]
MLLSSYESRPTVVCTDVVDSTRLAAHLGEVDNAKLWDDHDGVARALVAQWKGQELERTDGIVVAFARPDDALSFALEYRRELGRLTPPLPVRVGVHRATTTDPDEPAAVAGRVTAMARGGQVLLTRDALPEGPIRATPHGHWRIDDASPVEVFGVSATDAPDAPPQETDQQFRVVRSGEDWLPVSEVAYALPAEPDRFVGRVADLRALGALVDEDARLVTVTGIGGTGKTRLAVRFGWSQLGAFHGGVWFCDLSEARTREAIAYALAVMFDLPLGGGDPLAQIGHAIAGRGRCLIVLDNFEQITAFARDTVASWLARAPEATFLVTSREVLGLPGEVTFDLPPLSEPDAIELFARRAVAARPSFTTTPADRAIVVELVGMLDCLPLAIELAAARVRLLTLDQLRARMSQRFRLLTSRGSRVARQATLHAMLDWSWDLLQPDEQSALAQLGVFEGGFSLQAAEEVLRLDEEWPMDAVQSLVDKSLVRRIDEDRFDLLVSVQAYALEKLDATGQRTPTEAAHGTFYAEAGSDASIAALWLHGGLERRRELARDFDNVLSACHRAVERGDADVAVPTLRAVTAVLEDRGPISHIAELTHEVHGLELPTHHRATVQLLAARASWRRGQTDEARVLLADALGANREVGRRREEGHVIGTLGILDFDSGALDQAQAKLGQALQIAQEVGDRRFEGVFHGLLALLAEARGRADDAWEGYRLALAMHRELGNRAEEGVVLGNLAKLDGKAGRLAEAEAKLTEALTIHRETGYRLAEGFALLEVGTLRRSQGERAEAFEHLQGALRIFRELGNR